MSEKKEIPLWLQSVIVAGIICVIGIAVVALYFASGAAMPSPDAGVTELTQCIDKRDVFEGALNRCSKGHVECEMRAKELKDPHLLDDLAFCKKNTEERCRSCFYSGIEAGHLDYSETLDCYTFDCPATKKGCGTVWIDARGDISTTSRVVSRIRRHFYER